jgi:uncharacterized membrane protein
MLGRPSHKFKSKAALESPVGSTDPTRPGHGLLPVAWTGLAIWAIGLIGLGLLWRSQPEQATAALVAVATFYYAGQFGAIPLGLAMGGEPLLIAAYVWAADAAGVLVFFPLTQLGVDRLGERKGLLAGWIRRLRKRAEHHRAFVQRYGPWALYAFTSLPFLFNSPILGAVMGRIAGLRPRATLTALLAAITIMSGVWTLVFYLGIEAARDADPRLPWLFGIGSVALTFLVALLAMLVRALRRPHDPLPAADE